MGFPNSADIMIVLQADFYGTINVFDICGRCRYISSRMAQVMLDVDVEDARNDNRRHSR